MMAREAGLIRSPVVAGAGDQRQPAPNGGFGGGLLFRTRGRTSDDDQCGTHYYEWSVYHFRTRGYLVPDVSWCVFADASCEVFDFPLNGVIVTPAIVALPLLGRHFTPSQAPHQTSPAEPALKPAHRDGTP